MLTALKTSFLMSEIRWLHKRRALAFPGYYDAGPY